MKLAIIVGHNARAQGAVRVTDGRTEWDWNTQLAKLIQAHSERDVHILFREGGGGYSAEIDRVYAQADALGADMTIELHFNSSGNSKANGTETLTSGTVGSKRLAGLVQGQMVRALGLRDRGLKTVGRHDRGGRSLWQGKAPAALIEPYFGSNRHECLRADQHMDELAEAIYRAALQFMGNDGRVRAA